MNINKTSSIINNISEGFYRIAKVVVIFICISMFWKMYDTEVEFTINYKFLALEKQAYLVNDCSKNDISFYSNKKFHTMKGSTVNIIFCFQTINVFVSKEISKNGVPYKQINNDYFYVESSPILNGTNEGDRYVSKLMNNFVIPFEDLVELDKKYWNQKYIQIKDKLIFLILLLILWLIFCLTVRYIWLGFMISKTTDFKN